MVFALEENEALATFPNTKIKSNLREGVMKVDMMGKDFIKQSQSFRSPDITIKTPKPKKLKPVKGTAFKTKRIKPDVIKKGAKRLRKSKLPTRRSSIDVIELGSDLFTGRRR